MDRPSGPARKRVVLWVGTNDLLLGATPAEMAGRYGELLDAIPSGVEVMVLGLPPVNSHPWSEANAAIEALCAERGATFLALPDTGASPDGVHLSRDGYDRLAAILHQVAG